VNPTPLPERLSGWGRYPAKTGAAVHPVDQQALIRAADCTTQAIARGNGRSYGDAAIGGELTIHADRLDRLLGFDAASGLLVCEAGTMLADILDVLLPRGWIVPVTPGTRFVTIGGMIAADVHGKNHHLAGSFGDHVEWIDLAIGDGSVRRCSKTNHPDLFAATVGGMGLTGIIVRAAVRMKRVATAKIRQRTIRAPDLQSAIAAMESNLHWTYSVAWIDCLARGPDLGRSVIFVGEHAEVDDLLAADRSDPLRRRPRRALRVPVDFPALALSPLVVRTFNKCYYAAQRDGDTVIPLEPYFYPLDAIQSWNRVYGRRGFVQYQCVLPLEASEEGLRALLKEIADVGTGSFLAVLKRMGRESFGLLSFPREGYTLALDFPVTDANLTLLDRLDLITAAHGGRIYLAKDARATPAFADGYSRLSEFRALRDAYGMTSRFASQLSRRLEI
jgi:FAD/FMN-containing dehydrogenase